MGASPPHLRRGAFTGAPLLNQEGWRARAGVVSSTRATVRLNIETPGTASGGAASCTARSGGATPDVCSSSRIHKTQLSVFSHQLSVENHYRSAVNAGRTSPSYHPGSSANWWACLDCPQCFARKRLILTIWTILKLTRRYNFKLRHGDFARQDGHATTGVAAPARTARHPLSASRHPPPGPYFSAQLRQFSFLL